MHGCSIDKLNLINDLYNDISHIIILNELNIQYDKFKFYDFNNNNFDLIRNDIKYYSENITYFCDVSKQ